MADYRQRLRCRAHRASDGQPCGSWAIKGGLVCRRHGGGSPQAKAKAAVRLELAQWSLSDQYSDPLDVLHRLVSQSERRANMLAAELAEVVEKNGGSLAKALTRKSMITTSDGRVVEASEHVSALYQAESAERDRAAHFSKLAIQCGLHEKWVRLVDMRSQIAVEMIRYLRADTALDLTADQWDELPLAISRAVEREQHELG